MLQQRGQGITLFPLLKKCREMEIHGETPMYNQELLKAIDIFDRHRSEFSCCLNLSFFSL